MYALNVLIYYFTTVEVRNKFKGLDLIECLMNYGWRFVTLYRRQESRLLGAATGDPTHDKGHAERT